MRFKMFGKKLLLVMVLGVFFFPWIGEANVSQGRNTYLKKDQDKWFKVIRDQGRILHQEVIAPPVTALNAAKNNSDAVFADSLYQPYQAIDVGSWPEAVAIGDVNNDGLNDVVMTTTFYFDPPNDHCLFVFIQDASSGVLNAPLKYPLDPQGNAESVAIGDLNNDGLNDVAVGNKGRNLEILYQTVSGSLDPGVYYNSTNTLSIKIADFNDDGLEDVAGIGWGTDTASVWLQNSLGALEPPVTYSVTHDGYDELDAGDVNNDGLTDLVVMSGQGLVPNIGVLLQNPAGGFLPAVYYDLGGNELTSGVAVGDVTGDSRADITVSYGGNRPTSFIGVFAQNYTGTLNPAQSYAAYDCPEPVITGDANNDHRMDVIVAHGGWNSLSIYPQNSSGTLSAYQSYPLPYASHYNPQGMAAGDINNNGGLDIVLADYNQGLVILYHKAVPTITVTSPNGGESWQAGSIHNITWTSTNGVGNVKIDYTIDNGTTWLAITGSTENDGAYDWTAPNTASAQCLIRIAETDGSPVDTSNAVFSIVPVPAVAVTSPNGGEAWPAGSRQVITWTAVGCSGDVIIELYKGGIFTAAIGTPPANAGGFSWQIPTALTIGNDYRVRISHGGLEDYSDSDFSILYPPFSPLARTDLNGDGIDDILWRYYGEGGYNAVWLRGNPEETASRYTSSANPVPPTGWGSDDPGIIAIDSDSPPQDSLNREDWELTPAQLKEKGIEEGFASQIPGAVPPDSAADPFEVLNTTSSRKKLTASVMAAAVADPRNEPDAVELPPAVNLDWKLCGAGDFNGDGHADLLWRNMGNGANAVWFMTGTTRTSVKWLPTAANTDWLLCGCGDFNNDGKADLLWRNGSNGANAVWFMDGINRICVGWLPTAANLDWSLCGSGDFNNDGHPDLAWRNMSTGTNAVWFMEGLTRTGVDWLPTVENLDWTLCGTGDFNNDGKVDLLWRQAGTGDNTIWLLDKLNLLSTESLTTVTVPEWKIEN